MPYPSGPQGRAIIIALSLLTLLSRPAFAVEPPPPDSATSTPCSVPPAEIPTDAPPPPPPPPTNARPNIRLNEALPDPSGDDSAAEFIELRNDDDTDVELTGWSIADASEKKFSLQSVRVPAHGVISILYAESRLILNNDGERLWLADPDGAIVDEIAFDARGHVGEAYARSAEPQAGAGTDGSWKWTLLPTPGTANIIEERVPAPTSAASAGILVAPPAPVAPVQPPQIEPVDPKMTDMLSLAAFLPNPVGNDDVEWIELLNGGDSSVALTGWKLDDDEGGSDPFAFAEADAIGPHAIVRVMKATSRLALNNDQDAVRLLSPDGAVREEVRYSNAAEGKVHSKIGGEWQLNAPELAAVTAPAPATPAPADTAAMTRSVPDALTPSQPASDAPAPEPTTAGKEDGLTELSGIVTVPPGRISKATFLLLDDAGRGFTVRMYGKAGPAIAAGDRLTMRGRLHDADARPWISVTRDRVTASGKRTEFAYEGREIGALAEDDMGLPVSVRGLLTMRGNSWLRVADADGGGEIKATLPTGVSTGPMMNGSTIELRGIVRWTSGGPEIVLPSKKHLTIIANGESRAKEEEKKKTVTTAVAQSEPSQRPPLVLGSMEKTNRRTLSTGLAILGFTVLVAAVVLWKKRMRGTDASSTAQDLDLET